MINKNNKDLRDQAELEVSIPFYSILPDHLRNDEDFIEIWQEWIEHRKEIKQPLKSVGAKRQVKLLGKFKPKIAVAMIDRSIVSGWQGLFELHPNHPLLHKDNGLQDPDSQKREPLKPVY